MKTINTPKGEILVVKVPEGAYETVIGKMKGLQSLVCCYGSDAEDHPHDRVIRLPEGNWSILGTVNKKGECSEEDMRRFIEHIGLPLVKIVNFLLEANGLYINNPFNDPEQDFYKRDLAEKSTLQENECYLVLVKIN